jgi:hypothetical protein
MGWFLLKRRSLVFWDPAAGTIKNRFYSSCGSHLAREKNDGRSRQVMYKCSHSIVRSTSDHTLPVKGECNFLVAGG